MFAGVTVDRHDLATLSLLGMVIDIMGGLFLAYEILGRKRGTLRFLVRVVVNGAIPGITLFAIGVPIYGVTRGVLVGLLNWFGFGTAWALTQADNLERGEVERFAALKFRPLLSRRALVFAVGFILALTVYITNQLNVLDSKPGHLLWEVLAALGISTGVVISQLYAPLVVWWVDRLPVRSLGIIGITLALLGFVLQSLQYWVVVLNVNVK